MAFWDRILGRRRTADGSAGMELRLQFPPLPQFASKHSQIVVDAAQSVDGKLLDYSPESLQQVDRIIGGFHASRLNRNQVGETVFSFGCYVGEVMVRHKRGTWKMPSDTQIPEDLKSGNDIMVIEFPNGDVANPIGKVFKLLENGSSDSLAYFFQVVTPK